MRDLNGLSKGSGFVAFACPEEATKAVRRFFNLVFLDLKLFLEFIFS